MFRVEYRYNNKLIFIVESNIWKMVFANDDDIIYEDNNINFLKFKDSDGTVILNDTTANKYIIRRIILFSNEVKEGEAYVGQNFGNVRNLVKDKFLVTDTGQVFAVLDKYPEIIIGLDISNLSSKNPFYLKHIDIDSLNEIPDSSKIQSIAIREYINQDVALPDDVKLIELALLKRGSSKGFPEIEFKKIPLENNKKKFFLESLNKLQLFSGKFLIPLGCYEIRIYGKDNEELFLMTNGYSHYDIKRKRLYKSREDFLEKYWNIERKRLSPEGLSEERRKIIEENACWWK